MRRCTIGNRAPKGLKGAHSEMPLGKIRGLENLRTTLQQIPREKYCLQLKAMGPVFSNDQMHVAK
jgi:hypothetical protein